MSRSNIFQK